MMLLFKRLDESSMTTIKDVTKLLIMMLIFPFALMVGIERLVWANSKTYPNFLVRNNLTFTLKDDAVVTLHKECEKVIEVNNYGTYMLMRCGIVWPFIWIDKVTLN